jgi:hypothetical protein
VPRKYIVRVVLSPQHKEILDNICVKLGQSESETLRVAFLEYAKSISARLILCIGPILCMFLWALMSHNYAY